MRWMNACVLFADVKGFSSLEDAQLKSFAGQFMPALAGRLSQYQTEHINTWGDGIVVVLLRPREAAQLALELRDFFHDFDWSDAHLPEMDIRISLHFGGFYVGDDALTSRGLFSGKTINIAARIEPITPAGSVWVTDAFVIIASAEMSADRPAKFAFDHIGEVSLPKNAGSIKVSLLRRTRDEPLSSAARSKLLAGLRRAQPKLVPLGERVADDSFRVYAAVIVRDRRIAVVKRRENSEGLRVMFPSTKVTEITNASAQICREVQEEIGIACSFDRIIDVREAHPRTGVHITYCALVPLGETELRNGDPEENSEVSWMPIDQFLKENPDVSDAVRKFLLDSKAGAGTP